MLVRAIYTMLETENLLQQLDQFPIDGLEHGNPNVDGPEIVTLLDLVPHRVHVGEGHHPEFVEISVLVLEIEPPNVSFLVVGMILQLNSVFRHDLLSFTERKFVANVDGTTNEVDLLSFTERNIVANVDESTNEVDFHFHFRFLVSCVSEGLPIAPFLINKR